MITYLIIIGISSILIAGVNIIFNPSNIAFYWYIVATIAYVIATILIDGLFAGLIRKMPERWFDHNKKLFVLTKREKKFYEAIGIKRWKSKVPDLGQFTNFQKGKIAEPRSNEYLKRYMLEAAYGIAIHYFSTPLGFLLMLIPIGNTTLYLTVCLPIAIINIVLSILPAFTLKYNLAKLRILYERNERRSTT